MSRPYCNLQYICADLLFKRVINSSNLIPMITVGLDVYKEYEEEQFILETFE